MEETDQVSFLNSASRQRGTSRPEDVQSDRINYFNNLSFKELAVSSFTRLQKNNKSVFPRFKSCFSKFGLNLL